MVRCSYDPDVVEQLNALLDVRRTHFGNGVFMLDCGANIGVMAVEAARHMEGWGNVVAFEPQERIFQCLCGNLALNNLRNARAFNVALGKADGSIGVPDVDYEEAASLGSLELDGENEDLGQDLSGRLVNMVPLLAIDSYGYARVDLIKIDVEGMELVVLEGAAKTISRCKPILFVEHTKTGKERIASVLEPLGYGCLPSGMNLVCVPKDATYVKVAPPTPLEAAVSLGEDGATASALTILRQEMEKNPSDHVVRYNVATLLMQQNDLWEARREYDKVLDAAADGNARAMEVFGLACVGRAFANFKLGDLRAGFVDFEHRKRPEVPPELAALPQLRPDPPVFGKTVLVVGEMGFGDNIMFARYLAGLVSCGANVMVTVPPQMGSLFHCLHNVQVYGERSPKPDLWCHMMSLAYLFGTDIDTVPPPADFSLPMDQMARWKAGTLMHSSTGRLKVGLCWSGSRKSQYDKHRSIPLEKLSPLWTVPGVDFYSLQLDVRDADRAAYDKLDLIAVGATVKDFRDTACAIKALDLVITVDTSVAHLAGTLGVPTWTMLTTFRTYWAWIDGRTDSPWYPSMRCFRQHEDGDWDGLVRDVVEELRTFMLASSTARHDPPRDGKGNRILA